MEKELNKILDQIEALYYDENISERKKELLDLWTRYYQLSHSYHLELPRAYDLYLLGENVCYIVDTKLNYQNQLDVPTDTIKHLKEVVANNQINDKLEGISFEEASILLQWIVNRTWKNLSLFSIDMSRNSLNGFCEFAQLSSLYPLEQLGLKVTKNTAEDSFDYFFHHAFGTVEIPISNQGTVTNQLFLIDPTYKQFFTAVRCNHGRYYAKEENTGMIVAPDPGYFMKSREEIEVCENLIQNGYLLLTEPVAKIYGSGFQKASISLENYDQYDIISNYDGNYYIDRIKNSSSKYCTDFEELDGYAFELEIPEEKRR